MAGHRRLRSVPDLVPCSAAGLHAAGGVFLGTTCEVAAVGNDSGVWASRNQGKTGFMPSRPAAVTAGHYVRGFQAAAVGQDTTMRTNAQFCEDKGPGRTRVSDLLLGSLVSSDRPDLPGSQ